MSPLAKCLPFSTFFMYFMCKFITVEFGFLFVLILLGYTFINYIHYDFNGFKYCIKISEGQKHW